MEFEEQMLQTIQQKLLKEIKETSFTKLDYNQRFAIPQGMLDKLWKSVNWDEVIEQIRPQIQTRICNTVVGAMESEIKTDVKKLLSVDGVRQKLRMEVYPKMMEIFEEGV